MHKLGIGQLSPQPADRHAKFSCQEELKKQPVVLA